MKIKFKNSEIEISANDTRKWSSNNKMYELLNAFNSRIIDAVEIRKTSCIKQLVNNLDKVTYADDYVVCYGNNKHYSAPAMEAMERAIKLFVKGAYKEFLQDPACITQVLKACVVIEDLEDLVFPLIDALNQSKWNDGLNHAYGH
jgi:hypothetical protein